MAFIQITIKSIVLFGIERFNIKIIGAPIADNAYQYPSRESSFENRQMVYHHETIFWFHSIQCEFHWCNIERKILLDCTHSLAFSILLKSISLLRKTKIWFIYIDIFTTYIYSHSNDKKWLYFKYSRNIRQKHIQQGAERWCWLS